MDEEERIGVIEMLWEVAYADGELHDYEASLLRRVAGLLYVSDRANGEARLRVMAKLGIPRQAACARATQLHVDTAGASWLYSAATSGGGLRRPLVRPVFEPVGKTMYAVIKTGGKQYRVAKNEVIKIERLDGEAARRSSSPRC